MNYSEFEDSQVSVLQIALATLVLSDMPEVTFDLGVIHALSNEMYESGNLFAHSFELKKANAFKNFAAMGGDGTGARIGWIGNDKLVAHLIAVGFNKNEILVTDSVLHSKDEAVKILKLAKERNFRSVGSITVAFHGLRMLPYMVAAMKDAQYYIDYRMFPPKTTNWWMETNRSQGISEINSIKEAIDGSIKLEDHIKKGFAASLPDTLYYLENRARIVNQQRWN